MYTYPPSVHMISQNSPLFCHTAQSKTSLYAKFILPSFWQMCASTDMLSDAQRIQKVKLLIEAGYIDRILLAHDIHTKHRLVSDVLFQGLVIKIMKEMFLPMATSPNPSSNSVQPSVYP